MHNPFNALPLAGLLTLGAGLCSLGCDVAEPDSPSDRDAVLIVEVDGEVVDESDVTPGVHADLLELADTTSAETCEDDTVAVDLVLEVDGEYAASVHGCMDPQSSSPSGPDDLTSTDSTDGPGPVWCTACQLYGDCFSCCRCIGNSAGICGLGCG